MRASLSEGVLDLERYTKVDMKPEDIKDFFAWQWNAFRLYNVSAGACLSTSTS